MNVSLEESRAMPRVYVRLPAGLRTASGERGIVCRAVTICDALRLLIEAEPRVRGIVFDYRSMLRATVLINGLDVSGLAGLDTPLHDGDRVSLLPPVNRASRPRPMSL